MNSSERKSVLLSTSEAVHGAPTNRSAPSSSSPSSSMSIDNYERSSALLIIVVFFGKLGVKHNVINYQNSPQNLASCGPSVGLPTAALLDITFSPTRFCQLQPFMFKMHSPKPCWEENASRELDCRHHSSSISSGNCHLSQTPIQKPCVCGHTRVIN